jgi:hypothetical protein
MLYDGPGSFVICVWGGGDIYRTTRAQKRQILNYTVKHTFILVPPTLGMRVLACVCCRHRNENTRFRNETTSLRNKTTKFRNGTNRLRVRQPGLGMRQTGLGMRQPGFGLGMKQPGLGMGPTG